MDLINKTVIVTGASSGLGKSLIYAFAKEQANIVLSARRVDKLTIISKNLKKQFRVKTLIISADVRIKKDIDNLISKTINEFGHIDVFINNAGINIKKPYYEFSENDWDDVMNTNAKALFLACKALKPVMKNGIIVVISSLAGILPSKYYTLYAASKHAVEGYLKCLKLELSKSIKVLTFRPYRLMTELHKNYQIASPMKHKISPDLYASYIVARIKGNPLETSYYGLKVYGTWLAKIIGL